MELGLEEKGLRISSIKREYTENVFERSEQVVDGSKRVMTKSAVIVGEVGSFKYLKFFLQKNDGFDEDEKYRIMCRWFK